MGVQTHTSDPPVEDSPFAYEQCEHLVYIANLGLSYNVNAEQAFQIGLSQAYEVILHWCLIQIFLHYEKRWRAKRKQEWEETKFMTTVSLFFFRITVVIENKRELMENLKYEFFDFSLPLFSWATQSKAI